ncbi:MAG: hypothetical protein LAT81_16780, partial [Oceanicaulis sp.]|nr:hypothetical protein [Oceanicaulis sp.]
MLLFTIVGNKLEEQTVQGRVISEISDALNEYQEMGMVYVDKNDMVIQLTDITFETASACTDSSFVPVFEIIGSLFSQYMNSKSNLNILIEGHSDSRPVRGLVSACGYFENNFQLSTLRAINVRDRIL